MTDTLTRPVEDMEIPDSLKSKSEQIKQTAQQIHDRLESGTTLYRSQVQQMGKPSALATQNGHNGRSGNGGPAAEAADAQATFGGVPYQFFDLIAVGPFQPIGPVGPFQPSRIIQTGEPAFLIAAIWRNPLPLGFTPGNPSAAQIMTGQSFAVQGLTVNVNSVTPGPVLGPITSVFGAGNINLFVLPIPSLPAPPDLSPRVLDITLTIDVNGVAPFAGYASTWLQLDSEPPFVFPFLPGAGGGPVVVPGLTPSFVRDTPVRVLIYR
ncbi:hypothetical protein [Paractinoplanes lichenicola]|uniref:Uncharacterized protein n=1 Tax=Paractinoplanes lichenicola TaxID=2802976 RepID=A0ABS1VNP5_9ACTN|nr:hypothetical protein [Actinoplanes lichenicola]MBL7256264.1 hypothetical protein [Actinoplanes lichenicola]